MRSRTSTSTMKLLPLLCVCLVSRSGGTFAAGNGPAVLIVVEEGGDVVLPCSLSSKVDISSALFDWKNVALKDQRHNEVFLYDNNVHYNNGRPGQSEQFRGRVSHFPEELKHGNASIIIRNTKVADSGNYTCDFPRLQPRQRFTIQLVVGAVLRDRRNESIPGAAPEPSVTSLKATKDWSLLQCVVRGASPKPHVEWQDSSGNKIPAQEPQVSERGGSYDIILQTTVTKSDHYYCVATQESINHQTRAEIDIFIGGAAQKPFVTILDERKDWSLLQCEVVSSSPKPHVEWQDSSGNILPAKDPQVSERGGSYDIILQTTVTKSDHYYCVATQEAIKHQTRGGIYVYVAGSSTGWIIAVVSVLCTAIVGLILHIVLVKNGCISLKCTKGSTAVPLKDQSHSEQLTDAQVV